MTTRQITSEYEDEAPRRNSSSAVEREQRRASYTPRRPTRKRVRQAQEELQRHIDEFLILMSHELRTPITSVKANVQIALRQVQGLISRREQLEQAQTGSAMPADGDLKTLLGLQQALERSELAVNRLTRMVDDLLNAARTGLDKLD